MMQLEPYFLKNEKWYYHDEKEWKYKLTPEGKKNKKVVQSYNEFYKTHRDKDGEIIDP